VSRADVRCAIYTRKSTDEGLDQAFNTLDAQREASEAFMKFETPPFSGSACARLQFPGDTVGNPSFWGATTT